MSCPTLLVPGSLLAPLTLLGTLVANVLPKLWKRVPGDSIMTIQLSLLSASPPLTLPIWGLFQPNVGILCLALPPPSCLRIPFHMDTWAICHKNQAVLSFLWSLHWGIYGVGIHFTYPITFLKNFGIQHEKGRRLEFPAGLKAPLPLRNPSRISRCNVEIPRSPEMQAGNAILPGSTDWGHSALAVCEIIQALLGSCRMLFLVIYLLVYIYCSLFCKDMR